VIALDGEEMPWHDGMTVSDLLKAVSDAHHYAVIKVNGRYVSRPDFDSYVIPDDAHIVLIPMIAGG
jgi:thiamine biosynthesis protein ThiS